MSVFVLRESVSDDRLQVWAYERDGRYLRYYPWSDRTSAEVRELVQMFVDQQAELLRLRRWLHGQFVAPLNPADKANGFEYYISGLNPKALIIQSEMESPARSIVGYLCICGGSLDFDIRLSKTSKKGQL